MSIYSRSEDTPTEITVSGRKYLRIALNTPDLQPGDDLLSFAVEQTEDRLQPDDILVLRSEFLAIAQKRMYPPDQPTPTSPDLFAYKCTCKSVQKKAKQNPRKESDRNTPEGAAEIRRRVVETSDAFKNRLSPRFFAAARSEHSEIRILFSAFVGAIGTLFHRFDWFWKAIGSDCQSIFEMKTGGRSPYDGYLILHPENAETVAIHLSDRLGCRVIVADLRPEASVVRIIASSESNLQREQLEQILENAPMKVSGRRVPLCILRAR